MSADQEQKLQVTFALPTVNLSVIVLIVSNICSEIQRAFPENCHGSQKLIKPDFNGHENVFSQKYETK